MMDNIDGGTHIEHIRSSATDELRRLLDERGVEHGRHCSGLPTETTYKHGGIDWMAVERTDGTLHLYCRTYLTPEQAVEATLGRGTCKDSNNRFNAWQCSECGATMLLMFDDYDEPSYSVDGVADVPRYCPNCGRKVVDE